MRRTGNLLSMQGVKLCSLSLLGEVDMVIKQSNLINLKGHRKIKNYKNLINIWKNLEMFIFLFFFFLSFVHDNINRALYIRWETVHIPDPCMNSAITTSATRWEEESFLWNLVLLPGQPVATSTLELKVPCGTAWVFSHCPLHLCCTYSNIQLA